MDECQRRQGLVLLVGQRKSGLEMTLQSLQKKWSQENKKSVLILRQIANQAAQANVFHLSYENRFDVKNLQLVQAADVLVFENIQFDHELQSAVAQYEEGRLVILHVAAPSLLSALHRLYGLAAGEVGHHMIWRMVDGLQLMFSQTLIQNEKIAHEIVLVSTDIKKILQQRNLVEFETMITQAQENSGIVSLNQSLIQLLIRRQIEVKTAFEVTRDPMDLDLKLKKVGL